MYTSKFALTGLLISLGGCSALNTETNNETMALKQKVAKQDQSLSKNQTTIEDLYTQLEDQKRALASQSKPLANDLLPPSAKSGECYARVWVGPQYRSISDRYIASEASESVSITPAVYKNDTKRILTREASEKRVAIAAQYSYQNDKILVSEAQRHWHTQLSSSSPLANKATLKAAQKGGVNLDTAPVQSCYHEHYVQPEFGHTTERVLVSEASESVTTTDPVYETVTEQILVKDASTKLVNIPAKYKTITEQVMDKPAHTIWKKGRGPIQKIDAATGEIMCLVEVPASYKTVSKRILTSSASTQTITVPAEYKSVTVRRQVKAAEAQRVAIPAQYQDIQKRFESKPGQYVWHEVHDKSMSKQSRTGQKICLIDQPARYKTVKRKVVTKPAGFRVVQVAAQYQDVKVRTLVSAAREVRTTIPAIEKTVSRQELVKKGHMQWRSILCETNMTGDRLRAIQSALKSRGYNPGAIDGVIGSQTIAAVNDFQRDKKLPIDQYLNLRTLKALGVSVN